MNNPSMLVPYRAPQSGEQFQHNFSNRYMTADELKKPSREVGNAILAATHKQLNGIVDKKTEPAYASTVGRLMPGEAQFIKYTPKPQENIVNPGPEQRIIKMQEIQVDPLEPPKFKHKKIARGAGSPPPTIMHSPPRKLTMKDQQDWKVPPCISNWKNAKGYTIPLEMRLSADGRTLQQHTVSEKHAKLADAFFIAERQARKEIEERNRIAKTMAYKDYLKQEEKMREAAANARIEKTKILETGTLSEEQPSAAAHRNPYVDEKEEEEKKERDMYRYITKREIERERRLENAKSRKTKSSRDQERDISEKIALGMAQPTVSKDTMYDQRLFNQTSGLDTGFADEDEYNVYDKPLFQDKTAASIYNIKEYDDDMDEDADNKTQAQKAATKGLSRGFDGADKKAPRNKPVEFEKAEDDLFGLGDFIGDNVTKKVKKE